MSCSQRFIDPVFARHILQDDSDGSSHGRIRNRSQRNVTSVTTVSIFVPFFPNQTAQQQGRENTTREIAGKKPCQYTCWGYSTKALPHSSTRQPNRTERPR